MNAARPMLSDRFSLCLIVALSIHALLLLTLGFSVQQHSQIEPTEMLDVVLVNWRSEKPPEEADFLAQAAQQGGGDSAEVARPSQPVSGLSPSLDEGEAQQNSELALPVPTPAQQEIVVVESEQAKVEQVVTQVETPEAPPVMTAALIQQQMRMAKLQPELRRDDQWKSRLPKRRFISANTREYEFASYMQAWVAKVERVGNLNYPEEIRRRNLVGDLVLTVAIREDGSVEQIDVKRSSGFPELDNAATRIVQLAAPYSPLPENIRSQVDVLHITRTWRFSQSYRLE